MLPPPTPPHGRGPPRTRWRRAPAGKDRARLRVAAEFCAEPGTRAALLPAVATAGGAPSAHGVEAAASAPPEARFAFDFDDVDLPELVRLVGGITGKRFVYTGKMPALHASAHSPDRVTAEGAYQAFLAILEANGLTVVVRGRFLAIVASPGLPVGR
jgi:general secretion pathway protein D